MNPNYILFAIPFFLLTMLAEYAWGHHKGKKWYTLADTVNNLAIGVGQQTLNLFIKLLVVGVFGSIYDHFAFFQIEIGILSTIVALFMYDFIFYWSHRWGHELNLFWGAHIVHHQSEEYNLSVALRQPWFHQLMAFVMFIPMPLLGFHPYQVIAISAFATLYQYWIHTKSIGKLGFIENIMNTPSHHRVHHGTNPQYIDKNYGAIFIIWDRLFGTFQEEQEEVTYGITQPLQSWNPVWANVHFYVDLIRGMKMVPGLWNKLKLLFQSPAALGQLKEKHNLQDSTSPQEAQKRDTSIGAPLKRYVFVQIALMIGGLAVFMSEFGELTVFYRCFFIALMLLTAFNCGAILENRKWVPAVEISRIFLIMFGFNSLYYLHFMERFEVVLFASFASGLFFATWFILRWTVWLPKEGDTVRTDKE